MTSVIDLRMVSVSLVQHTLIWTHQLMYAWLSVLCADQVRARMVIAYNVILGMNWAEENVFLEPITTTLINCADNGWMGNAKNVQRELILWMESVLMSTHCVKHSTLLMDSAKAASTVILSLITNVFSTSITHSLLEIYVDSGTMADALNAPKGLLMWMESVPKSTLSATLSIIKETVWLASLDTFFRTTTVSSLLWLLTRTFRTSVSELRMEYVCYAPKELTSKIPFA